MISTLEMITDVELDDYALQTDNVSVEDSYATTPMAAIHPLYQCPDEEELYTSFEAAISDRLVAVQERLSRISDLALNTPELQSEAPAYQHPRTESLQLPYVL